MPNLHTQLDIMTATKGKPAAKPAARRSATLPAPHADDAGPGDGRHHRSLTTRKKIVAALTELIREGVIAPTAEQVSARADVGLRTVFRHFDDMETLYREMNTEFESRLQIALRVPFKSSTWRARLLESVRLRARLFEQVTPFYISTQVHRHESPFLREQVTISAALHRDLLKRLLPAKLSRDRARFGALDLLLSIDAWIRLRREQGLSVAQAIKVMQTAAACLTHDIPD